jgi:hypothetical protein
MGDQPSASVRPSFKSYSAIVSRFKGFTTKNTKGVFSFQFSVFSFGEKLKTEN